MSMARPNQRRGNFWNRTVGARLSFGFALVLLLMVGTLATDVVASNQQDVLTKQLLNHLIPARESARKISNAASITGNDGALLLITNDPKRQAKLLNTYYNVDLPLVDNNLQAAHDLADTQTERDLVQQFRVAWYSPQGYLASNDKAFTLKAQGKNQAAYDAFTRTTFGLGAGLMSQYEALSNRRLIRRNRTKPTPPHWSRHSASPLESWRAVLGAIIAFVLTRSIVAPLRRLTTAARQVARGDVSATVDVNRADELGVLAGSFQSVAHYLSRIAVPPAPWQAATWRKP